jgi:thiamine-phosphate pyrophosphorylase
MIRCAITDGARFGNSAVTRRAGLLADAARWAELGVDFVQLREKTLDAGELVELARAMGDVFREHGGTTKLLVNGRVDVAIAAGADGVHLTSSLSELTAAQVRTLFAGSGRGEAVVGVSCHTLEDVERAREAGVDLVLFGPVLEKRVGATVVSHGVGLEALRGACEIAGATPVLALGGVDEENVTMCVEAGAAGIAGIRIWAGI